MPSTHGRLGGIVLVALAGLLVPGLASRAAAQGPDIEARWRQMFRREAVPPAPPDSPLSPDRIALGAGLFADVRLSGNGRRSCTSCHRPERALNDRRDRKSVV